MSSTNGETDQVFLVEEKSSVRIFTLNRPKQLNALSAAMVSRLLELLLNCAEDSSVKLIILKGKGRAFCAGGDVMQLFVTLIKVIGSQVSLLNGIVMGGGAGYALHSNLLAAFAMPETALGLFPDIGASYFLSRLPGFFGEYVGLTGARLDGAEMLACGLATHFVQSEKLPMLEEALVKADSSVPDVISSIIDEFSQIPNLKKNSAYHRRGRLLRRTMIDLFHNSVIEESIPMSLKISLRSIREGGSKALVNALSESSEWVAELYLEPSMVELISDEMVDRYFSKMDDEDDWEDLKLPVRSNLPAYAIAKL
ncbi:hypothetical protein DH2020_023400 [Rehmannia glutinosa]|uniref:3-hydroxyisobutyryl-CoA hydrolase n=1 Tax=Rehmannia glutinosa TaxID=99300 RepID=A0ABR0W9X4_REHGL